MCVCCFVCLFVCFVSVLVVVVSLEFIMVCITAKCVATVGPPVVILFERD